ncbi:GNAT family N-acetyltransferase [Coprococcus sp. AF21-14LB]|uniref:GNAT family N-acetyltransferase n=1 Tax=Coprococcus sp. AF21-14LB TaxID=2292231 RepID=UPI000E4D8DD6|nr:GNAT family protein [Coprococcus sp. AF21-14LB]RGS81320.1 N-acetyltransferase [Coprococcus sp. AF21-14LB]
MRGEKVNLRPIEKRDLEKLNQWKNDKDVYQFLGGGYQPISIDQQEQWMNNLIDLTGDNKRFIITDKDQVAVGMVGLYGINWIHRTCEIGLYIGDKNVQKRGYASEAYRLLEKYAIEYLNLRKINLKVVSANTAAIFLWEKLGFEKIGEYHKERFIKGKYYDVTVMEKFI